MNRKVNVLHLIALSLSLVLFACDSDDGASSSAEDAKEQTAETQDDLSSDSNDEIDEKDELSSSSKNDNEAGNLSSSSEKEHEEDAVSSSSADKSEKYEESSSSMNESKKDVESSSSVGESKVDSILAIKDRNITGICQKGRFWDSSSVKLYELDESTLSVVDSSFFETVTNNRGAYTMSNISLKSPYALLEVRGYYYSELSPSIKKGYIALNALADLTNRDSVNINLLTHLEYVRAKHLIDSGMSVLDAKKQAKREILRAFEIKGDFANSEDLSFLGTSDGDAALIALGILVQGALQNESEFPERLNNFIDDIAPDGVWDDSTMIVSIADWAKERDMKGEELYFPISEIDCDYTDCRTGIDFTQTDADGLDVMRSCLGGDTRKIADFEKFVRNFWSSVYGLGECNSSTEGNIAMDINPLSKYISNDAFYCTSKGWISLYGVSKNMPKVVYMNPEIQYGLLIDSRDGKKYKTIQIGDQEWMAENLNYSDSIAMPALSGHMTCNENDPNCSMSGRYYDRLVSVSVCPDGWHLPDSAEWHVLLDVTGGFKNEENPLRSTYGWHYGYGGTNVIGFSAIPVGWYYDGFWYNVAMESAFWVAMESNDSRDHDYVFSSGGNEYENGHPYYGGSMYSCEDTCFVSIRCVKDAD